MKNFLSTILTASFMLMNINGFGYDYSILVPAGKKECYYQPITTGGISVEFEYQVLDQSPVNFHIMAPNNIYIAADIKKSHNVYPLHLKETGIYQVCILNRYTNQDKTVYIGLYSDNPDHSWPFANRDELEDQVEEAETIMDMSATEILKSVDTMVSAAEKMRFLQQSIRTSNVKDFIVQRRNFSRVNTFSGAQLFIMVAASLVQVYTIRKLFGDNTDKTHNMKMAT